MKKKILILALAFSSVVWAGDFEDGEAAYKAENYTLALSKFKSAAEQGNAQAQFSLGEMYGYGQGVEENNTEAVKWYTKAAEQDHIEAQYNLAIMHENGLGVEENKTEAMKWYAKVIKAAEQGDTVAQEALDEIARQSKQ